MGEVYRARDTRLQREVALKVLPPEVAADPARLARFEREARGASALNHPNIVTIHDFGAAGDDRYLVMELVRGETLRDAILCGPLPLERLLLLASGIADGLAAAHGAGLTHRDLKPENVMVTPEGTPKILDFGLVKSSGAPREDLSTETKLTSAGTIVGTSAYMAPEQARGESVGPESDQFTLGMILHEMATGRHPFGRGSAYGTLAAIIGEEAPPLPETVPEPLAWVVERCLAKDPSQRYASTADLARDLRALRGRVASPPPRGARAAARPRKAAWALAAALALAAIAILVASSRWRQVPQERDPIHLHLNAGALRPDLGEVAVPVVLSPDGRYLIVQGAGPHVPSELWLHDLRTGEARVLAEPGFGAAWSDDGRSVAFFADGKLKTVSPDGGPPRVVCDALPEGTPAWSGRTILFPRFTQSGAGPGIYRVDAGGGTPDLLVPFTRAAGKTSLPWWPHFLPDGNRFLFVQVVGDQVRGTLERELMLGSLDGSAPRRIGPIESRAVFSGGHLLHVNDGVLLAQRFDPDRGRFTGEATPLIDDLHFFRSTGMAAFSVSANGMLAWCSAAHPRRLVWLDRTGAELGTVETARFDSGGRLSPDGTRYAVGVVDRKHGTGDVWVYDLERGAAERATFEVFDQKAPVWAPDGRTLYFRSDGSGGPPDVFVLRPGESPAMFYKGPGVEHPEDVSPDGKWLLLTTLFPGPGDIHLVPLDGSVEARALVATPFDEHSPRFSPDGALVAYSSTLSGKPEIYLRRFDGSAPAVRVSRDGGTAPRWSADGKELFFLAPGGRVMTAPREGAIGAPRTLFQAPGVVTFEVAPDGERFLAQIEDREGRPDVQLVINWPSLVRGASEERR